MSNWYTRVKAKRFIETAYNILVVKGILFLIVIIGVFVIIVLSRYFIKPFYSDNLLYVQLVNSPFKDFKVFFRFFHFYIAKICILPVDLLGVEGVSDRKLLSCALFSIFYSSGIIFWSYLIVQRLASRTSAILAAILVASISVVISEASLFGPDVPCLFFGLIAIYLAICFYQQSGSGYCILFSCGFFLLGAVFSKTTGVAFLLPVFLILLPKYSPKRLGALVSGFAAALLFISICDYIWLDDFFYHINPYSYFVFSNEFSTGLGEYIKKGGIQWKRTFFQALTDNARGEGSYLHYTVFLVVALVLISRAKSEKAKMAFYVMLVAIISLLMHEIVHVKDTLLNIWDRWIYTVLIPIVICYCIVVSSKRHADERINGRIDFVTDVLLTVGFCIMYIGFSQGPTLNVKLQSGWNLSASIIHVFSFWIFLAGIALYLGFSNQTRIDNGVLKNAKKSRYLISCFGLLIVVAYTVFWGQNISKYNNKRLSNDFYSIRGKLVSKYRSEIAKETLIVYRGKSGYAEDVLLYLYLNGDINKKRYLFANKKISDPFEYFKAGKDRFVLTAIDNSKMNKLAALHNYRVVIRDVFFDMYLYETMPL